MAKRSFILSLFLLPISLVAKPSGPEVVQGNATFAHPTKTSMQIVTGDQTIINWNEFSIEANETTRFVQPSRTSAVLNRVTSGQESQILGSLFANGKVFLINSNGILIGSEAVIDTHGFVASTLDVLDSEFMKGGDLRFRGNSEGKVVNLGKIQAWDGDIALIGRFIENIGQIHAPKGTAALAVGKEVLLKPNGEERVFICALSENASKKGTGISSLGEIEALKVRLLADGNPYKLAINHEGKIDATKVEERNGEIFLIAENGIVEVHGEIIADKGEIRVLGDTVALNEGSLIDASCNFGAGKVFIGGAFQGKDPNLINSSYTFIHPGATVKVNSYLEGDGGLAVIWSDGATHFHGLIEAQGGKSSGNGGLVEVSGKRFLDIAGGIANRSARAGRPGRLLYDPSDVKIVNDATSGMVFSAPRTHAPTALASYLDVADLISQLNFGPVEVTTNSAFAGTGDITITADMNSINGYSTPNELILTSDRDLIIQASIQNSGSGNITCNIGRDLQLDGSKTVSQLGSQLGHVHIKTGRHVLLMGGSGGQAQIGFDNPLMTSHIDLTVGGDLIVQSIQNFALIGHTNTSGIAPVSFEGNVTVHSVGGNLMMSAGSSDFQFAQIGIASDQCNGGGSGNVRIKGNVAVQNVQGTVKMMGGSGTGGAYTLIGHGGRGRSFTDTYSGSVALHAVGDISILGGQDAKTEKFCGIGFAQEFATPSTHHVISKRVSVETEGNLFVGAGQGANHGFIGAFTGERPGVASINIEKVYVRANNLTLVGDTSYGTSANSSIGISGVNGPALCNIAVDVRNTLDLKGVDLQAGTSNVFISNAVKASGGHIDLLVHNGNLNLIGGLTSSNGKSQAFIQSHGGLDLKVIHGDLNLSSQDLAFVNTNGMTTVFAGRNITLYGDGKEDPASITTSGLLTVHAGNHLNLIRNASIQNTNGILKIITGNDLNMSPESFIHNTSGNPIYLVVDHDFLSPRDIRSGGLKMAAGSQIIGEGPIRIYAAKQELNALHGTIGGASFTPGLLYADASPEQWLTYYSSHTAALNSPFAIFYKNGVLSAQNIQRSQVVISEMLTSLHPFDEYLGWFMEFQTAYAAQESAKTDHKVTSSFQVIPDQLYYLRMKKTLNQQPKNNLFITFPKPLKPGKE